MLFVVFSCKCVRQSFVRRNFVDQPTEFGSINWTSRKVDTNDSAFPLCTVFDLTEFTVIGFRTDIENVFSIGVRSSDVYQGCSDESLIHPCPVSFHNDTRQLQLLAECSDYIITHQYTKRLCI